MSSSWLNTKKRGRDDAAIERDRAAALSARRAVKNPSTKKKKAARTNNKRKKKGYHEDSPSSMEDFIVDDDDEEISLGGDEYGEDSSVSSTAEESTSSTTSRNGTNDGNLKHTLSSAVARSRTSSMSTNFSRSNRSFKPKSSAVVVKTMCNDDDDAALSDDSSIQVLGSSRQTSSSAFAARPVASSNHTIQKESRYFPKIAPPTPHGESPLAFRQRLNAKRPFVLDDTSDNDSPLPSSKLSSGVSNSRQGWKNTNNNESGSDDEDEARALELALEASLRDRGKVVGGAEPSKERRKKTAKGDSSSYDDDDEDVALGLAIRHSLMDSSTFLLQDTPESTKAPKKKVRQEKSTNGAKLVRDDSEANDEQMPKKLTIFDTNIDDVLNDSDDDGSSDGNINEDEDDEYVDPAAREAQSVLQTANELSVQIMQTLQEWSDQSVDGLVSSGALTLGTMEEKSPLSSSSSSHQWISQEDMAKCCPKLTLADYQLIGVNWMALLHGMQCEVGGVKTNVNGILADEMGLGKTIQTISFLSWLRRNRIREESDVIDLVGSPPEDDSALPHLVIAPASVLSNWEREFETFAPHLQVIKYHGSMEDRNELQTELRQCFRGRGKRAPDVILAPVTYFQKEKSDDRSFLRKFDYEYLVVDEAHLLKNARGTRYKTLDKFRTRHRLLLTGTPVQNSPQELLSLLCFLMPLFSRKAEPYDDDEGNDGGQSMLQHFVSLEGGSICDEETAYEKLKQLFAPFVLRRRKEDVLSQIIPPKVQKVEFVELDSTGRLLYDTVLSDHIKSKKYANAQQREHLFTQLRKAAHHPLLLRSRHTSPTEKEHMARWFHRYGAFRGEGCTREKVAEELERYNDFMVHLTAHDLIAENPLRRNELNRYILQEDDLFSSAKFVRLQQILPELIAGGHRILIFSGWTSCLDLLTCLLEKLEIEYLRMEGSTPVEERQSLIDQFNRDASIPIFLLSTKACGLGINLTSSDTCLFYDIDFNPMNDAQAEDRCHRIGQKKEVTVIRLVSKDTVDQDIYEMQQRKMKMSQVIMETNAKPSAKEKSQVLQTAVDRFLQSPTALRKNDKSFSQESRDRL